MEVIFMRKFHIYYLTNVYISCKKRYDGATNGLFIGVAFYFRALSGPGPIN